MEDELSDNLDEISEVTKRLKALGMQMGEEIGEQMKHVKYIDEYTGGLDDELNANTERVRCYSNLILIFI